MQASAALPPLSSSLVGVVQWTLMGIEVLVLAYVLVWVFRHTRLRRLARPFRWRQPAQGEGSVEVERGRAARLVSMGGGAPEPLRTDTTLRTTRGSRVPRPVRTPPRPSPVIESPSGPRPAPRALLCPACGTLLARGEPATRLVTRCTGCDRRVAVRTDGDRVVVTVEG